MISEYHVNLILSAMENLAKNQERILDELKEIELRMKAEIRERVLAVELPKESWAPKGDCKVQEDQPTEDKEKGSGERKEPEERKEFRLYRKRGGKLGFKTWLSEGKPGA